MKMADAIRAWIDEERDSLPPDLIATSYEVERVVSSAAYASVDITTLSETQRDALLQNFLLVRQGDVSRILDEARAHAMGTPTSAPNDQDPIAASRPAPPPPPILHAATPTRPADPSPTTAPPPPTRPAPVSASIPTAPPSGSTSRLGVSRLVVALGAAGVAGLLVLAVVGARAGSDESDDDGATTSSLAAEAAAPTPEDVDRALAPADADDRDADAVPSAPFPTDEPILVEVGTDTIWEVTVGAPVDFMTSDLREDDHDETPPDGVAFAALPVVLTLIDTAEQPTSLGFSANWTIEGGATGSSYDESTIDTGTFGCGFFDREFDRFAEVLVGGTVEGVVCIPVPTEDLESTESVVGLSVFLGPTLHFSPTGTGSSTVDLQARPTPSPTPAGGPRPGTWENPHPFGAAVEADVGFGTSTPTTWSVRIASGMRDITAEVLAENQFNDPPPDGVVYGGFGVEVQLVSDTGENVAPGSEMSWLVYGGATLRVYEITTLVFGCGVTPDDIGSAPPIGVGSVITATVCIPIPTSDLDHPATRVALRGADEREVFAVG